MKKKSIVYMNQIVIVINTSILSFWAHFSLFYWLDLIVAIYILCQVICGDKCNMTRKWNLLQIKEAKIINEKVSHHTLNTYCCNYIPIPENLEVNCSIMYMILALILIQNFNYSFNYCLQLYWLFELMQREGSCFISDMSGKNRYMHI